ncbi:hypothetical protein GMRT_13090 [Giardia muris]|uniref:Uncharacterized protein n=1 Tax=Giardia muris TaxID=5742 RepID=A0A4Z1T411_GIAMU|nr:hypothetical protein GMRT_13090 [Giardia muris]|eukprot:TNJ30388.1 hypothetical protein GMRT_13090 [Giardia muris]
MPFERRGSPLRPVSKPRIEPQQGGFKRKAPVAPAPSTSRVSNTKESERQAARQARKISCLEKQIQQATAALAYLDDFAAAISHLASFPDLYSLPQAPVSPDYDTLEAQLVAWVEDNVQRYERKTQELGRCAASLQRRLGDLATLTEDCERQTREMIQRRVTTIQQRCLGKNDRRSTG